MGADEDATPRGGGEEGGRREGGAPNGSGVGVSSATAFLEAAASATRFAAFPDFGQPEELPSGELLWPVRPDQRPEVVHTVEAFLETLLFEPHIDRCVVLPDGVRKLGQGGGIPEMLRTSVRESKSMRDFLDSLGKDVKAAFKARLWHYGKRNAEKEIKASGKRKSFADVESVFRQQEAEGQVLVDAPLYISELRWLEKVRHPSTKDELVKTATNVDVYDITPLSRRMPLWERSEGGIFVGERGAGSGMHVDQCLWSNVGRNWCGHKLFALWGWEERHSILDEAGKGAVMQLPLTEEHRGYLERAKIIAHVRPGDVWVFSGGQPHTAVCVGDGLNVSAYESFVPAHPAAVGVLVRSNTKDAHWRRCWMDDDDLDELYEDVVDNLQAARRELGAEAARRELGAEADASIAAGTLRTGALATADATDFARASVDARLLSRLEECVQAMRQLGDAYCRELWEQEDDGKRRRRREESDSSEDEPAPAKEAGKVGGNDVYSYSSYTDEEQGAVQPMKKKRLSDNGASDKLGVDGLHRPNGDSESPPKPASNAGSEPASC